MSVSRVLPLALGITALASGTAMLTFDVIFAVTLSRASSPGKANVVAMVASVFGGVTVVLLTLLLGHQVRYRTGTHIQDFGHGQQHTYLLAGFAGVFGIISAVVSVVTLGLMRNSIAYLPRRTIHSSTESLVTGGFILWTVSLLSQALFVICMVFIQRRDSQQQIQPYNTESPPQTFSEMENRPRAQGAQGSMGYQPHLSLDSKTPPSSSGRSLAGSDTMASFRSSLSQVVRPITSKTKLIQNIHKLHRPTSLESSTRDTSISIEDGFDSWDTSTVDAESRQTVASASPTQPRFLETIPASPTTSRSPSPGFPLDLEPPKTRTRRRSYSPANSYKDLTKTRTMSPIESSAEAHIHPLFRTDSPTPPPTATPGTIVTAAPGAGQVISDRHTIRTVRSASRMRSGSLPSSPLMHSNSLDSIKVTIEREERERERLEEAGGERTLTPPIPDWILRSSMSHYNKKAEAGLGKVGEAQEV